MKQGITPTRGDSQLLATKLRNIITPLHSIFGHLERQDRPYHVSLSDDPFTMANGQSTADLPSHIGPNLDLLDIDTVEKQVRDDLTTIIKAEERPERPFVPSDILSTSTSNLFMLHHDMLHDPVIPFETIIVYPTNDPNLFSIETQDDEPLVEWTYDELITYLDRVEGVQPYEVEEIPRQHLAWIDGQVHYINRDTGEVYPVEPSRLYVANYPDRKILLTNALGFLHSQEDSMI